MTSGIELEGMAIEMPEVEGHPNRKEFRGVLTYVDMTSDRPPSGGKGHRVVLTRKAAEEALPSLLGMALDYAPSLDRHDFQRKVGVITSAEVVGRELQVSGYLFAKDFPEIVSEIEKAAEHGRLGMSYEVSNAKIADRNARVWILSSVVFTGAAVLRRNKAAYGNTWIEMGKEFRRARK